MFTGTISRASKATQIIHPLDQMWIRPSKNALRLESVDRGAPDGPVHFSVLNIGIKI
jgi:hypothetical protein